MGAILTAIFGVMMAPPADRAVHWFLLLVVAYTCAMHTLSFGHSRYHEPIMPIVLLYAACAIVHRREIWQRRDRPIFWFACGLCALFVAGWAWEIAFVDWERYRHAFHSLFASGA